MLYPLSYEGGGFESVSAQIGAPGSAVSARVPGTPGTSYIRPQGLAASLRFVYLGLIFDDKAAAICGIPRFRARSAPY